MELNGVFSTFLSGLWEIIEQLEFPSDLSKKNAYQALNEYANKSHEALTALDVQDIAITYFQYRSQLTDQGGAVPRQENHSVGF